MESRTHPKIKNCLINLDSNGAIVSIESGYANLTPRRYRQEYSIYPILLLCIRKYKNLEGVINLLNF